MTRLLSAIRQVDVARRRLDAARDAWLKVRATHLENFIRLEESTKAEASAWMEYSAAWADMISADKELHATRFPKPIAPKVAEA